VVVVEEAAAGQLQMVKLVRLQLVAAEVMILRVKEAARVATEARASMLPLLVEAAAELTVMLVLAVAVLQVLVGSGVMAMVQAAEEVGGAMVTQEAMLAVMVEAAAEERPTMALV